MSLAVLKENAVERKNFLMPSVKLYDQKFEFIFLLDRSGSMAGGKMNLARRALSLFLRSVPMTCRFNIMGFGSTHDKLFPVSVEYNQNNLEHASNYAELLQADLGQTHLLPPMQDIYWSEQTPGFLTQIFIITDGQSEQQENVIQLVRNNSTFARVFSLGIGEDVDGSFVLNLAGEGGGIPEFVKPEEEKIESKVLSQLSLSLKPSYLEPIMLD